jgi:hypothetical protein
MFEQTPSDKLHVCAMINQCRRNRGAVRYDRDPEGSVEAADQFERSCPAIQKNHLAALDLRCGDPGERFLLRHRDRSARGEIFRRSRCRERTSVNALQLALRRQLPKIAADRIL